MAQPETRFAGSVPENYDAGLGPVIFERYAEEMARRTAAVAPGSVLELAGGTDIVSRRLRDALAAETELVVTDLNAPMLDIAGRKFSPEEKVRFETADATDLPYANRAFDAVVCQFGVMFFPDKSRGYEEALRVLAPGGHYFCSVWDSWAENPFGELTHRVVERFFPDDPPGFYRVPFSYHDPEVFGGALEAAGFVDIEIEHVPLEQPIPSPEQFARGLVFGNPLHEEIVSRGGDADEVRRAMTAAITERFDGTMPLRTLFATARRPA